MMIRLLVEDFAPAFVVQVSYRAVHELIGCPLQRHDVGSLMQREVTWDCLHVVPLKQPPDVVNEGKWGGCDNYKLEEDGADTLVINKKINNNCHAFAQVKCYSIMFYV